MINKIGIMMVTLFLIEVIGCSVSAGCKSAVEPAPEAFEVPLETSATGNATCSSSDAGDVPTDAADAQKD